LFPRKLGTYHHSFHESHCEMALEPPSNLRPLLLVRPRRS
jgi:hypothetical protein